MIKDQKKLDLLKSKDQNFISDMGPDPVTWGKITLPRYGVWSYGKKGKNKYEVVESGNNLEYLMKKYNVPKELIARLK